MVGVARKCPKEQIYGRGASNCQNYAVTRVYRMLKAKGKTHLFNHPYSVSSTNIRAKQAIRYVETDPLEHALPPLALATFTFDILVDSYIFILIIFFRLNNSLA